MSSWPVLARALAAHGLHGGTLSLPAVPVEREEWAQLMAVVEHERITGLMLNAIIDGTFPVTSEQWQQAEAAHRASMVTALDLEATLLRTVAVFDQAGIDHRVLKGSAVAHLDYSDPAIRSFGDVDLLVRPSQFDAAVEVLTALGHRRKFPEPRRGFDRRFGKGTCLIAQNAHEIDLHRTLAMGPYGVRIDLDTLWRRSSRFELGGRQLSALGAEERFLHACFHAALGDNPSRLASLRDVAQMHLSGRLDPGLTRELISSWEADAVVARALRLAAEALGLEPAGPLASWATEFSPGRRDRRFLAVYGGVTPTYAAKSFAAIRAIPGLRDKAAFVFTLALPDRDYVRQRHEGAIRRWRRGLRQILRAQRSR